MSSKKIGSRVSWRAMNAFATEAKKIRSAASWAQPKGQLTLNYSKQKSLSFICLSDLHALSYGTDHQNLERIIDEIMAEPDLKIGLVGDLCQMSIKMRSVMEVSDNVLPPEMQMEWLESFLNEIKDRVLFCTWDNHSVTREESQSGVSVFARLAGRNCPYFAGIGHVNVKVGKQTYKIAVSHKFNGGSMLNPCHSQMRYLRFEGVDREIAIAGDSHKAGIVDYTDGKLERLAVNCGSTQDSSGYAQRYFSLFTHDCFPIVTLRGDKHEFSADKNLAIWKERQ